MTLACFSMSNILRSKHWFINALWTALAIPTAYETAVLCNRFFLLLSDSYNSHGHLKLPRVLTAIVWSQKGHPSHFWWYIAHIYISRSVFLYGQRRSSSSQPIVNPLFSSVHSAVQLVTVNSIYGNFGARTPSATTEEGQIRLEETRTREQHMNGLSAVFAYVFYTLIFIRTQLLITISQIFSHHPYYLVLCRWP